jgi:hypothetical protein
VEKYQFALLAWLNLSDNEAKAAANWFQGPGWYHSFVDAGGKKLDVRCVAKSETANHHAGILEALNMCGADGWSVAAFVPAAPDAPSFILQRPRHWGA